MTHSELCELTARRFVEKGSLAIWEVSMQIMEKPDVLVMNSSGYVELFEIKMTHNDFLADAKKEARKHPMFGDRRYFVCEWGLIQKEEVPEGWGLIWYKNNKFYTKKNSVEFHDIDKEHQYKWLCWVLINEMICRKRNVVIPKRFFCDYNTNYIKELETN